jgi:hypothetical protein
MINLPIQVPIISSGRLNTRTPYTILTPIRLSNKLTAGAAITVGPFASVSSKALPSATRSLSSIVTNVKNGYNNYNNLTTTTPYPSSYFISATNYYYIESKTKHTRSFENTTHQTFELNDDNDIYIAFIKPSFTGAAYHHSFYVFYTLYGNTALGKNIRTDTNLLTSRASGQTTDS